MVYFDWRERGTSINGERHASEQSLSQVSLLGDRSNNQDRAAYFADNVRTLLVVADGMGGHADGAAAAQCVIDAAALLFETEADLPPAQLLQRIAMHAHIAITRLHPGASDRDQPRTTAVMCHICAGQALFAHAGDSRGYHLRGRQIVQRTRDHSLVEIMVSKGEITEQQALKHPLRNQVSRCLGGLGRLRALELTVCPPLQSDDCLLLCSDGFWAALSEDELASRAELDALARTATGRGQGRADNCTALRNIIQRV